MKVTFEVLDRRDLTRVIELSSDDASGHRPWVTEMDALRISVHLEAPVDEVKVIVSDGEVILSPDDESGCLFSCMPGRRPDGRYKSLFYNYFGVAPIYVETVEQGVKHLVSVGELEVLARKASVEQAKRMVSYVLESGNIELLRRYGATRRGAGPSEESGLPPNRLIEHLEDTLRVMENTIPPIARSPIHSLTSELKVVNNPGDLDIQDQGVAWLCENLGVLEVSDDIEDYVMIHDGRQYRASSIQAPITRESNDVYENRVIHGFIDRCIAFVHQLKQGIGENSKPVSLNKAVGYESFFSVMGEWLKVEAQIHIDKLELIAHRLKRLKSLVERRIDVTQILIEPPKFTPKARANRNYSTLYKAMHEWYRNTNVDWTIEKFLMAINSIPKLFELYSVLVIAEWLKSNGRRLSTEADSFISVEVGERKITLKYEPEYWRTRHLKANESSVVGTQIKKADEALRHWQGARVHTSGQYQLRAPDIALECSEKGNHNRLDRLVILDAKYVRRDMAFEQSLPDCTMKYVHGLTSRNRKSLVDAMVILYPDTEGPWLDYHAWDYGLFGATPQQPVLGAMGLLGVEDNSMDTINRVMSRLMSDW